MVGMTGGDRPWLTSVELARRGVLVVGVVPCILSDNTDKFEHVSSTNKHKEIHKIYAFSNNAQDEETKLIAKPIFCFTTNTPAQLFILYLFINILPYIFDIP